MGATVLTIGRGICAILQPLTGARATGTCVFRPVSGATEQLPPHTWLYPIVSNQIRPDLGYKVLPNPAAESGEWAIAAAGTAAPVVSNIGGKRHNVPVGTEFRIEPDAGANVAGTAVTLTGFAGGTDAFESVDPVVADLGIANVVLYETFGGSSESIEQFNANVGGRWPLVMLFWSGDEPADGYANNNTSSPTKRGSHSMQYAQDFELWLVCSRQDSEAQRRGQAMRLLDEISWYLYDRMSVDGLAISSPGGIKIKRRSRETGTGEQFFKAFRVYSISLSATITQTKRDISTAQPLVRFHTDYLKENRAPDGTNLDLPLLHDIITPNT